jgi:EAL domain-containing protein (putative c-di-GMP-specific phosphodiesterase class I)
VQPLPRGEEFHSLLERTVSAAHHHLGLDAVYICELTEDTEVCRVVAGDGASFAVVPGTSHARSRGLAQGIATRRLPALVRDVGAHPLTQELAKNSERCIGAFIGVPLHYSDGSLHGMICGLNRHPDHTLDERDVRFMSMLAELLTEALDSHRELEQQRAAIDELIQSRQLRIAAQPIIDLRTLNCLGIEALSRFRAPFGSPARTFAAADAVGLGLELERLAVQQAWDLLARLGPDQFLTINVSPATAAILARRALDRPELPLHQLVIEITEHAAVASYTDLRNQLHPLRHAGLRVAVDDAGAGYASMRHVVELRPDFVKIDRDLIHGLADDHARRVAVSAFVLLALDLGATVVAEGLERAEDLDALRDLGVDAAQGHLLGKPSTSRRDIDTWLSRQRTPDLPAPRSSATRESRRHSALRRR